MGYVGGDEPRGQVNDGGTNLMHERGLWRLRASVGAWLRRRRKRAMAALLHLVSRFWAARVGYRWDIEWLESSGLYQAYRVMRGLPIYGPPRSGLLP